MAWVSRWKTEFWKFSHICGNSKSFSSFLMVAAKDPHKNLLSSNDLPSWGQRYRGSSQHRDLILTQSKSTQKVWLLPAFCKEHAWDQEDCVPQATMALSHEGHRFSAVRPMKGQISLRNSPTYLSPFDIWLSDENRTSGNRYSQRATVGKESLLLFCLESAKKKKKKG